MSDNFIGRYCSPYLRYTLIIDDLTRSRHLLFRGNVSLSNMFYMNSLNCDTYFILKHIIESILQNRQANNLIHFTMQLASSDPSLSPKIMFPHNKIATANTFCKKCNCNQITFSINIARSVVDFCKWQVTNMLTMNISIKCSLTTYFFFAKISALAVQYQIFSDYNAIKICYI